MELERLRGALTPILKNDRCVEFAYLFGSVLTRQDARDIDVAVLFRHAGDPWLAAEDLGNRLEHALSPRRKIDVRVLNDAAAPFIFRVLQDGVLLCERARGNRLRWEAHVVSRYQDLKPMLDSHDRRFLSR